MVEGRTLDPDARSETDRDEDLTVFCTRCGHRNRDDARFCAECGAPLQGDPTLTLTPSSPTMKGTTSSRSLTMNSSPGRRCFW